MVTMENPNENKKKKKKERKKKGICGFEGHHHVEEFNIVEWNFTIREYKLDHIIFTTTIWMSNRDQRCSLVQNSWSTDRGCFTLFPWWSQDHLDQGK